MTSGDAGLAKRRHPVRGVLWGIPLGLGLAIVLVVTKVISLELAQIVVVLLLGIAAGLAWSMYGPARAPSGNASAPESRLPDPPEPPAGGHAEATDAEGEVDDDPLA